MHGRRQFVPQGVLLSQITNETLIPICQGLSADQGTIGRPLARSQRKARATVGQYAPNAMGYTRNTKDGTMGCNSERNDAIPKPVRSSD